MSAAEANYFITEILISCISQSENGPPCYKSYIGDSGNGVRQSFHETSLDGSHGTVQRERDDTMYCSKQGWQRRKRSLIVAELNVPIINQRVPEGEGTSRFEMYSLSNDSQAR